MLTVKDTFIVCEPFRLESGAVLPNVEVAYETYGRLNSSGDNAVLVCHALTGSAHAAGADGWWGPLIGPGCLLDTNRYYVVCSNLLGSCYGSTGPTSLNVESGRPYGWNFPEITVRDMVNLQRQWIDALGIAQAVAIGGSLGGMVALEWALLFPERISAAILIATSAAHSPWAIGWNHVARLAIQMDPAWTQSHGASAPQGLSLARAISMLSFRSFESFEQRMGRTHTGEMFSIASYLRHQGNKLVDRFDPRAYVTLTHAMDSHDISRDRSSVEDVLAGLSMPVLSVGISSDVLYPAREQRRIAHSLPNAEYQEILSPHGHDAFLIEFDQLHSLITPFLENIHDFVAK